MSKPSFVSVGSMVFVSVEKITVIFPNVRSEPVKKVINERRERGMVLDFTNGKKTRAAILTTDGYILLSPKMPKTIVTNIQAFDSKDDDDDDSDEEDDSEAKSLGNVKKIKLPIQPPIEPDELLDGAVDGRNTDSVF